MATVQRTALDALAQASGWGALAIYGNGMRWPGNPYFSFHDCSVFNAAYSLIPPGAIPPAVPPPDVVWSSWNGTDTLVELLNAADSVGGWTWCTGNPTTNGYAQRVANPDAGNTGWWLCEVPGWMLPYISGRALGPDTGLLKYLPPIWPGTDYVTYGDLVTVTEPTAIGATCNGVIVTLVDYPVKMSTYDWGDRVQVPRAGYVAFLTDLGDAEDPQPVTWPSHIICPKLCRLAAGLYVRPHAGVTLDISPWTYTSP